MTSDEHNHPSETFDSEALSGPVIDRRTTIQLLSAAGLAGFAGCSGGGDGAGTEGEPAATPSPTSTDTAADSTSTETSTATPSSQSKKYGGRLKAGWFTGSIDTLDPPYIGVAIYFQITANVFNGLVTLKKDLTVRGDLAKDWQIENDGKKFVFDLREGVKFHNGTEFTAEDVKYTITRTLTNETPATPKLNPLKDPENGGVVVVDDYTVELNFEKAFAPVLIYLTRGPGRAATIVNQEAIEKMGRKQYGLTPVGTGPFKVTEHKSGQRITLDRFEDYFETDDNGNQLPYLDGVDIQLLPEASTLVNAIQSGDIEFANAIPLQNVSRIENAAKSQKLAAPGINWSGLAFNNKREPFTSKKVRLGIAKLINNEAFVKTAFFGQALPDTGVYNKAQRWVWRGETGDDGIGGELKAPNQTYAPEEGKQLLNEAGASNASFSILTSEGNTRPARVLAKQLQNRGLDASVESVPTSTYWDRLSIQKSDFDTTIVGSAGDPEPDQSIYNFFRKPGADGVWNFALYKNDTVHQLIGKQRRQLDREQRKKTLWKIEDRLITEAPYAFLYHTDDIAAKRPEVKGFTHIPFMRNFHTVWLDQ